MTQRIVVVGGGAAGIGAAGAAKATDPAADVRVYTEFEDVGYSPCGIPYVHGKEIPTSSLPRDESYLRSQRNRHLLRDRGGQRRYQPADDLGGG